MKKTPYQPKQNIHSMPILYTYIMTIQKNTHDVIVDFHKTFF